MKTVDLKKQLEGKMTNHQKLSHVLKVENKLGRKARWH
jgi:hypothetical protein